MFLVIASRYLQPIQVGYKIITMRLRATLSVRFYCRASKAKHGEAPIELGVNVDGNRFFVNLPRKCKPKDLPKQKDYTTAIESRIRDYELWCLDHGKKITAEGVKEFIRNGWSVPAENIRYWVEEYLDYIEKKNICQSVKNKHRTVLMQFLEVTGITMDDSMEAITPGKIRTYGEYLNSNYKRSSVSGMLQKLKGAMQFAVEHQLLDRNPWNIRIKRYEPDIQTITFEEYERIKDLDLTWCERLERVRDLWLFSCNTGLAYADTQSLQPGDFKTNEKGQIYIQKGRCKTGVQFTVVVLPDALEIAKKYGYRLPTISNQRMNSYLVEIQDLAKVDTHLTTHRARHFYARMLLNKYHFSMEVTARCLGHATTMQTKHYAKLFNSTVFDAFGGIQ